MCKIMIVMVMLVVAVSGCNMADGFFEDVAGTSQAVRNKVTTPMADKAKARDAEMSGEAVARYHAEQAGRFSAFAKKEQ